MVLIKKVALKLQTPSPKVALQRLGQQQKAGAHHDSPSRGAVTCTALSRQSPSIQEKRFLFVEKAFMHLEMDGLCKALTFSLTATNGLLSMICFHNPLNAAS